MRTHLQSVLTQRFGRITKVDPGPRLERGLIGFTTDGTAREFVAVVDPALVNVSELNTALNKAARAKQRELPPGRQIPVRAQAGCYSAAEVREAYDVLREVEQKYPRTLSAIRSVPEASAFRVFVPPGSPAADELRDRLGDRVIVEEVVFGTDKAAVVGTISRWQSPHAGS